MRVVAEAFSPTCFRDVEPCSEHDRSGRWRHEKAGPMTDIANSAATTPEQLALGTFIRERRMVLGLTQTQLAERCGWVQERISLLEHGKYGMPSVSALARLAHGLDTRLFDMLAAAGFETNAVVPARFAGNSTPALLQTM